MQNSPAFQRWDPPSWPSHTGRATAGRLTPKNCQGFRVRTKVITLENKPLSRQNTATKLAQLDAELGILNL